MNNWPDAALVIRKVLIIRGVLATSHRKLNTLF